MFPQQMTRIIVMAKYDKIELPGSNNMYCTQLWALTTTKALYQVWEQDNISQREYRQLYLDLTKYIEDNTVGHVDIEFLFECLTWYLTSKHIIWTYLWWPFSKDFWSLFEDFLRFLILHALNACTGKTASFTWNKIQLTHCQCTPISSITRRYIFPLS